MGQMMNILVCPKCNKSPVVYYGCRNCGCKNIQQDLLLHHYCCAYVGKQEEFGSPPVCPKCRYKLTPGSDFERLKGPYVCGSCGSQNMEREFVAMCSGCDLIFPLSQAEEKNVD